VEISCPPQRFLNDLTKQAWQIDALGDYLQEISTAIAEEDGTSGTIGRVQQGLSLLYTLVERLVADETDEGAAEVKVQIASPESDFIEYKSSLRYNVKTKQIDKQMEFEVIRAIAGLANDRGGTVYIGVDDNGDVLGTEADFSTFRKGANAMDQFRRHFDQIVAEQLGVENYQIVEPKWVGLKGKQVFVVPVKSGSSPTFFSGEFYVRRGARTVKLNGQQFYEYYKARWPFEPPAAAS